MDPVTPITEITEPLIDSSEFEGKFNVLSVLGTGGAGIVYKATQVQMKRVVAIKVCRDRAKLAQEGLQRFQRECQILSKLNHPNIVQIFAWGVTKSGLPFLAMEYAEGKTLADAIKEEGKISPERCIKIAVQVCEALKYAHALDVVHRDIKPSNIMLCTDSDGNEQAKLLDFGIAKFIGADLKITKTDVIVGSPRYMAPEQFMAQPVDGRADLYALACTLYEALTGKTAHEGETPFELFNAHLQETYSPLPDTVPENLRNAIAAALRADASTRVASSGNFLAVLTENASGIVPVAAPPAVRGRKALFGGRLKWALVALPGLLVLVAIAGWYYVSLRGDDVKMAEDVSFETMVRLKGYDAAMKELEAQLLQREKIYGPESNVVADYHNEIAVGYLNKSRLGEAESHLLKAKSIYLSHPTDQFSRKRAVSDNYSLLMDLENKRENRSKAAEYATKALEYADGYMNQTYSSAFDKISAEDSIWRWGKVERRAAMNYRAGHWKLAEEQYVDALARAILLSNGEGGHLDNIRVMIGICSLKQGKLQVAEAYLQESLQQSNRLEKAIALQALAQISGQRGDSKVALERFAQARDYANSHGLEGIVTEISAAEAELRKAMAAPKRKP